MIRRVDVAIVAIDYRLASEDGLKVWLVLKPGELFKIDCDRIGVAGDSAGRTPAANLCVAPKAQGEEQPFASPGLPSSRDNEKLAADAWLC